MTRSSGGNELTLKRATLLFLSTILLLFPLYAAIVWFIIWKEELSQSDNVVVYLNYFPGFLRNTSSITGLSFVLSILANLLSIIAWLRTKMKARRFAIPLILIGVPMMLWWGFTLL